MAKAPTDKTNKSSTSKKPYAKPPGFERAEARANNDLAKTYGHIPGIPVGKLWMKREDCKRDHVHTHSQGGISWGDDGAYCVVLSGGYDEDVDGGDTFIYTGSGVPNKDQTFDKGGNKGLQASVDTQNPVRVIRGHQLDSPWAPEEGYRYDGLYYVTRAWLEPKRNGKMICRFSFQREAGQPPLQEYKYRQFLKDRLPNTSRKRWMKPKRL